MIYSINYTKHALEELEKLDKELSKRIISVLERIRIRPFSFVLRLVGTNYYRLRVGEYRVILDINNNELIILVIELGHRKNIYK